jgi:hypothetical protein
MAVKLLEEFLNILGALGIYIDAHELVRESASLASPSSLNNLCFAADSSKFFFEFGDSFSQERL